MAYDHSTKVGNQGDLVKHVALYAAFSHLLEDPLPESKEFVYVDVHAGRPQYVLPKGGEWQRGVAQFSKLPMIVESRTNPIKSSLDLGAIYGFDQAFVGRPLTIGAVYPGSAGIAFRMLRDSKRLFRMFLWEKDHAAADDLERHFHPWSDRVSVNCGDGYHGSTTLDRISLILLDPPALESEEVLLSIRRLKSQGVSYVCWTPRTSCPVESPEGAWSGRESDKSRDFVKRALEIGPCLGVQWNKWGARTAGCRLSVSQDLKQVIATAISRLSTLMGWTYEA
jgi:23S rRNA A2030 N6-methylase RlmJ